MNPVLLPELTPENGLIFRVTHIRNVPWILDHGLHCSTSETRDPGFIQIGIPGLIAQRARHTVPIDPKGVLGDYIPFYFTPRSVMLFKIVTGHGVDPVAPEDLVILVSSLPLIAKEGIRFVFTDRHASLNAANFSKDLRDLSGISWDNLQNSKFSHGDDDPQRHERYQAEALVHRHLPTDALELLVCYRSNQQGHLAAEIARRGLTLDVRVHPHWFFG